jgi:hypothetical protein
LAVIGTGHSMEDFAQRVLGEDAGVLVFKTWEDAAQAVLALTSQARKSFYLLSYDLDLPLYSTEPFSEAVKSFCLRSRYSEARVIVQDSSHAVKHGHRLVELSRRLTTCIQIRTPLPGAQEAEGAFLVVDGVAVLTKKLAGSPEGTVDFRAPAEAKRLTELFSEIWEHSTPDPELRTLHI